MGGGKEARVPRSYAPGGGRSRAPSFGPYWGHGPDAQARIQGGRDAPLLPPATYCTDQRYSIFGTDRRPSWVQTDVFITPFMTSYKLSDTAPAVHRILSFL